MWELVGVHMVAKPLILRGSPAVKGVAKILKRILKIWVVLPWATENILLHNFIDDDCVVQRAESVLFHLVSCAADFCSEAIRKPQFGIKGPLWSIWWPAMFSIASSWLRKTQDGCNHWPISGQDILVTSWTANRCFRCTINQSVPTRLY